MTDSRIVPAAFAWPSNAELIAEVATLGYIEGHVLDATYGMGTFWKCWRPEQLTTNDIRTPADHAWNYRALGCADQAFDTAVFDPDYKLNGTPALEAWGMDERYGVDIPKTREERMTDIRLGAVECYRAARRYLLVKCQDQVEGGIVRWQTIMLYEALVLELGARLMDKFDLLTAGRTQPGDDDGSRTQRRARRSGISQLLVFERPGKQRIRRARADTPTLL